VGRPTKLTPEIHADIVERLGNGEFREQAAAAAGIDSSTFRRWMLRAEEGEEPYAQFAHDVAVADAKAEGASVSVIKHAQYGVGEEPGDWKAAAWLLEHKFPKRWGLRLKVEVAEELGDFLAKLEKSIDPETFERVLCAASDAAGIEKAGGAARVESDG
jgi:hypothetical protein